MRYQTNSGEKLWDAKHEMTLVSSMNLNANWYLLHSLSVEIERVKKENDNMHIELRHLKGEDLNSLYPKELIPIEEALQIGSPAWKSGRCTRRILAFADQITGSLGGLQGLHNIHGSFNLPNVPGSLASREVAMGVVPSGGVQQPGGSIPSGRFSSNNLLVALSQMPHGSGVTNRRGSASGNRSSIPGLGVSPVLGLKKPSWNTPPADIKVFPSISELFGVIESPAQKMKTDQE
ncbi:hypothetical protein ZIOFF_056173 [Zingiber officinale]|uniref:K-box domain-containing protein n=1 Tax=Zingiber officinale TaxID=94328 RepID=A0A8J5FIP4_ZINOF|nr:hypothetical protein ZIOFF_056173 [Zingiber officinale]